jgi:preprotein translocase subunit SecA
LEVENSQIEQLDWQNAQEWIVDRIKEHFLDRQRVYFDDPDDPRVVKSIETGLKDISGEELSDSDLVTLLSLMAEGRQAAFDKKSHRRIWLRTQRLRYHFYAAELLVRKAPEEIEEDILNHLENARQALQETWGEIELARLKSERLSDLESDLGEMLREELGEETFTKVAGSEIDSLSPELRDKVQDLLGRTVMSKIYRDLFLRVISELWVEYLTEMEALRVAIGLEAYAQRDPLVQYKSRGFEMFQRLMADMRVGVVSRMFTFQPRNLERVQAALESD